MFSEDTSHELRQEIRRLESELAAARSVIEAARKIRAHYPGGKLLWFDEFSAFEAALERYDAATKEKP